ncbi:MAG TPA: hypothetical protein VF143_03995 [Candidatus Nanopelagicales bacterium]
MADDRVGRGAHPFALASGQRPRTVPEPARASAEGGTSLSAQRVAVMARLGPLRPDVLEAIRAGRGREFQRLELMGDSVLEVVMHAHALLAGPGCPHCHGRADRFTTDTHLSALAREIELGSWLDRQPAAHRLGDLVEACVGAVWVSSRWPGVVGFVATTLHPLAVEEQRTLLHGGGRLHPECPARGREIAGAAILEAAASTGAYLRHPEGDEGDLSRIKARMLGREHVLSRCRESKWVRRTLRRRHFVRDDVERALAEDLLAHGLASAITIAWPLVT